MVQGERLDVLIYAHDGRGLGHASRSIGVGMAMRRLFPERRVLFVSGCRHSQELIGRAPLDWLKLPSYETEVVGGRSVGVQGKSMFSDEQLGKFRGRQLADIISLYRPRLVLVDHTPQGKHRELVPALTSVGDRDCRWVLGVRGVVGEVKQARSELAAQLFSDHYQALLWYGDSMVLGSSHCEQLVRQYGTKPVECGYVVRLAEFINWNKPLPAPGELFAGTVAVPWLGERSVEFLCAMVEAIRRLPKHFGRWILFIDRERLPKAGREAIGRLIATGNCQVEEPGGGYVDALLQSKIAVIYGGYNSLMDVVYAEVPAMVVLREMQDDEQQIHLQKLKAHAGEKLSVVSEGGVYTEDLEARLLSLLGEKSQPLCTINTAGAVKAATYLNELLS